MEYEFDVVSDHIILKVKQNKTNLRLLMDTGASFNIMRGEFYGKLSLAKISEKVGTDLDALVGYPYMKGYTLLIDWRKKKVRFTTDIFGIQTNLDADKRRGLIDLPVTLFHNLKEHDLISIFDTGAKISYIHSDYVNSGLATRFKRLSEVPVAIKEDFYPFYGEFITNIYTKAVRIDNRNIILQFGVLPKKVEKMLLSGPNKMILGTEICKKFRVKCSMSRNLFTTESYNEKIRTNNTV